DLAALPVVQDALKSIVMANNRCKPFPPAVEHDLLRHLRAERVWPCFENDPSVQIGKRGWKIMGYHERQAGPAIKDYTQTAGAHANLQRQQQQRQQQQQQQQHQHQPNYVPMLVTSTPPNNAGVADPSTMERTPGNTSYVNATPHEWASAMIPPGSRTDGPPPPFYPPQQPFYSPYSRGPYAPYPPTPQQQQQQRQHQPQPFQHFQHSNQHDYTQNHPSPHVHGIPGGPFQTLASAHLEHAYHRQLIDRSSAPATTSTLENRRPSQGRTLIRAASSEPSNFAASHFVMDHPPYPTMRSSSATSSTSTMTATSMSFPTGHPDPDGAAPRPLQTQQQQQQQSSTAESKSQVHETSHQHQQQHELELDPRREFQQQAARGGHERSGSAHSDSAAAALAAASTSTSASSTGGETTRRAAGAKRRHTDLSLARHHPRGDEEQRSAAAEGTKDNSNNNDDDDDAADVDGSFLLLTADHTAPPLEAAPAPEDANFVVAYEVFESLCALPKEGFARKYEICQQLLERPIAMRLNELLHQKDPRFDFEFICPKEASFLPDRPTFDALVEYANDGTPFLCLEMDAKFEALTGVNPIGGPLLASTSPLYDAWSVHAFKKCGVEERLAQGQKIWGHSLVDAKNGNTLVLRYRAHIVGPSPKGVFIKLSMQDVTDHYQGVVSLPPMFDSTGPVSKKTRKGNSPPQLKAEATTTTKAER
ncbi:Hypothetical Protein FCC1311_102192, partial [Hondaea fermentalgiana]